MCFEDLAKKQTTIEQFRKKTIFVKKEKDEIGTNFGKQETDETKF